jgi:nitrogen fixation protein FixH
VITITGADIVPEGTILIDVTMLNTYTASGTFTKANMMVDDTAANAICTHNVTRDYDNTYLTLTSSGGPTVAGENVTMTFRSKSLDCKHER